VLTSRPSVATLAGYLAGIAVGGASIALLFLGMRAVLDVGGACADGGPLDTSQPCPNGVPLALVGGMVGLFAATGLIVWFGSRLGRPYPAIVALGWPILFLALGFNFVDYGIHPPEGDPGPALGWLAPGVIFWILGAAPLAIGLASASNPRAGRSRSALVDGIVSRLRPGPGADVGRDPGVTIARPGPGSLDPRLVMTLVAVSTIVGVWLGAVLFAAVS
jgi:hypothetical protein